MNEVTLPTAADGAAPTVQRFTSTEVADFPFPQGREEIWRFTPIAPIQSLLQEHLDGGCVEVSFAGNVLRQDEEIDFQGGQLKLLKLVGLAPLNGEPFDRAGVVAWNNITQTLEITLKGNAEEAINIDLRAQKQNMVGHVRIIATEDSKSTVILRHSGDGSLNETVEISAFPGSELNVVSLQEWDLSGKHLATHQITLHENAKVHHCVVTLGGDIVRISSGVKLPEQHSDVNMLGLYFTGSAQHQECRLFIDHIGEKSKSRVAYKGALQGQNAHAVWVGDVGIGPQAYGTDSYELNRNLVLGKGPKVDSVPNLEIHNGEIEGAGHASATGRFDDEQLFYLQSRGIAPVEARRLVVKAFYAELLNQIAMPELTEHVLRKVDSYLEKENLQ